MKKLIFIAIAIVGLSSCDKQRTCTCTTPGSNPHEILGYTADECAAYDELVLERKCTYDD